MENSWTVVQFTEDNTVEAVPSIWINENRCHWPLLDSVKLRKAIKHCEPVGDKRFWQLLPIKCLRNATYKDYAVARRKCQKAETEMISDLASDHQKDVSKKRPIKRPMNYSSSSSSSEVHSPPKNAKKQKIWNLPAVPEVVISSSNIAIIDNNHDENSVNNNSNNASSTTTFLDSTNENNTYLTSINNKENASPKNSAQGSAYGTTSAIKLKKHKKVKKGISTKDSFKQILKLIKELQMELKDHRVCLDEIQNAIRKLSKNSSCVDEEQISKLWDNFKFPITTEEELETFESFLTIEDNMEKSTRLLSKIGGNNEDDFVRRSLKKLIGNEVQIKYSWAGLKKKKKFAALQTYKLIISSAQKSLINGGNEKLLENAFKNFLRRAPERALKEKAM